MASIKNLKKDIQNVLGDIIEECYAWELMNTQADTKGSEAIIDEAISTFDSLIDKIHLKNVKDKKAHYKAINVELEGVAEQLLDKVNKL